MKTALNGMRFDSKTVLQDVHSGAKSIYVPSSPEAVHNGNPYCDPSCVLYLPGFPGSGATIYDFSGNGNHGAITGATWARLDSGLWVREFNGVSSEIVVPNPINGWGPVNQLSYLFWYKAPYTFTGAVRYFFDFGYWAAPHGVYCHLDDNTSYVTAAIRNTGGIAQAGNIPHIPDKWTHIVLSWDGTNSRYYKNGVEAATMDALAGLVSNGTTANRIGTRFNQVQWYDGYLWGLSLFTYSLSAAAIYKIFQSERSWFGV